ncbi:MAG: Xaa-Pro aminopeptidase [Halomonas sp.]|uniref:Xaa-Pro aminopeptidase n=1 Tax=Halomonas sp. TaxID=1486246 RepID=UPI003F925A1E
MNVSLLPPPPPLQAGAFARRRQRLMAGLANNAAVLIPGAQLKVRSADTEYPFRQASDFHYLTGFPEPDALLVLLPGHEGGEAILFCLERDPDMERWTGRRIGAERAMAEYGVDQAFENAARDVELPQLLAGRTNWYLALDDSDAMALAKSLRVKLTSRRETDSPIVLSDMAEILHEQRLIKSDEELSLLRYAAHISARAHCRAMASARPGLMEYQLQAELEHEFRWLGANGGAYDSIVASGNNACVLHYIENDAPLRAGDLVLIDAGAEYQLYAGDITRTFPVNGRFTEPQRALYEVVLGAQQAALDAVRPGTTLPAIHALVQRHLTEGLLALGLLEGELEDCLAHGACRRFYPHATSHWLGLDVHDVGGYTKNGKPRRLEAGMALTIEPGLYIPDLPDIPEEYRGIGIRIEDDVVVTPSGGEVLTSQVPSQVADIEQLMARGRAI